MPLGNSIRFEVFTRDGFTCQYCGRRPPTVVLEVDHIHPRSKGGTDDSLNLITACFACNRGKRAKTLTQIAPRPDADLAFLREAQIAAEIKRFLKTQREADKQVAIACKYFTDRWRFYLEDPPPNLATISSMLKKYGPTELETSLERASMADAQGRIRRYEAVKYVWGILNSRAIGGERPPRKQSLSPPSAQPATHYEF
jgi:hypothetical protein